MRPPASTYKGVVGREWGRPLAILSEVDHGCCGGVGLVLEPLANSQHRLPLKMRLFGLALMMGALRRKTRARAQEKLNATDRAARN